MQLYRIENLILKPLLVFARSHDDAADMLEHALVLGLGNRPDADFDVVTWSPYKTGAPRTLQRWENEDYRGFVWNTDDGEGWEFCSTQLFDPGERPDYDDAD